MRSVVGEGRKLCRIIFHLLEDPSALLCTHYVRCAPHYRYPGGGFIYLPSAVLYLSQTRMNRKIDVLRVEYSSMAAFFFFFPLF